jgi:hypothetical protein
MEPEEAICHTAGSLETDRETLVWVGKVRGAGFNELLAEELRSRKGKRPQTLLITPDWVAHYPADCVVVVNAEAKRLAESEGGGHKVPLRESEFYRQVARSPTCRRLLEGLVARHGEVWANVFLSHPTLVEALPPGFRILGPPPDVAVRFNHKPTVLEFVRALGIPVLPTKVVASLEEAALAARRLIGEEGGAYVAGPTGTSGSQSCFARSEDDVFEELSGLEGPFIVQPLLDVEVSPTVLGCVANPKEVLVGPVGDQVMVGPKWIGSLFPSRLPEGLTSKISHLTELIGQALAKEGYRGIFGCDWLVTPEEELWFVEINARKVGSALEVGLAAWMGDSSRCNLAALELYAVKYGTFRASGEKLSLRPPEGLHFGVEFVKETRRVHLKADLPKPPSESELFSSLGGGERGAIFDHPGAGMTLHRGFLARMVAVADSRLGLRTLLSSQRRAVEKTIGQEASHAG